METLCCQYRWIPLLCKDCCAEKLDVVPLTRVSFRRWRGSIERQANPREARLYRRIEMDEHAIVVFILHEMALGRDSHWAPYLRVSWHMLTTSIVALTLIVQLLPESIPVPWLFTESELDALQVGY